MGRASRRKADRRARGERPPVKSRHRQAFERALRAVADGTGVTDRIRAVTAAVRSGFFGANVNAAITKTHPKPKDMDEARDVVLRVLRDAYGVDTTDVVLKLHLARGVGDDGLPLDRLTVTEVMMHPRLMLPVVERFKAEGRL